MGADQDDSSVRVGQPRIDGLGTGIEPPEENREWDVDRAGNDAGLAAELSTPGIDQERPFVEGCRGGLRIEPLQPCASRFEKSRNRRPLSHQTSPQRAVSASSS